MLMYTSTLGSVSEIKDKNNVTKHGTPIDAAQGSHVSKEGTVEKTEYGNVEAFWLFNVQRWKRLSHTANCVTPQIVLTIWNSAIL